MARYAIPPDIREKEKVVGGILTVSQTILIAVGGALSFVLVQGIFKLSNNIVLALLGLLPMIPTLFLALYKKHDYGDMELTQYLIFKWKFDHSRKEFPNINENFRKR